MIENQITINFNGRELPLYMQYADFVRAERATRKPLLVGSTQSNALWQGMTATENVANALIIGLSRYGIAESAIWEFLESQSFDDIVGIDEALGNVWERDVTPYVEKTIARAAAKANGTAPLA